MKTRAYSYIRFSTPEQIKGDSLRRQKERSEEYARKNNLELDYTLKLEDLGISAFKGKNAIEGALAGFLAAVQTGKVKKGSYLLIESLDRLSRDKMSMALSRFIDIINAGITIVTLIDEVQYNKESIDKKTENLFTAIVVLMRAHEESATKSERVSKAWEQKRKKAIDEKKPLTKRCPAWLVLKNGKYQRIPDRVIIIKRIFKLAIEGMGKRSIAKMLNRENVDTWGDGINNSRKANGWHDSYIQKILTNESVIGRYHVHLIDKETGKRVSTGEIIENYYPKVISDLEWSSLRTRVKSPRGKKGSDGNLSNLFTGIVYDGYTKAVMRYVNKGAKKGHGKYLSSDISRINPNTKGQNWSYHHFETVILNFMISFDWSSLSKIDSSSELNELLNIEAELKNTIELEKRKISRLLLDFNETDVKKSVVFRDTIVKMEKELSKQENILLLTSAKICEIKDSIDSYSEGTEEFKKLCHSSKFEDRIKLQTQIRRRIKKILIFRHGDIPLKYTKQLHKYNPKKSFIVIEHKNIGISILSFSKIKPMKRTIISKRSPRIRKGNNYPDLDGLKDLKRMPYGHEIIDNNEYFHEFFY